jgi:hypothetical protein
MSTIQINSICICFNFCTKGTKNSKHFNSNYLFGLNGYAVKNWIRVNSKEDEGKMIV